MHLFFDTIWKLHIGEIPEKPKARCYESMDVYKKEANEYYDAIAALKQNALTVGNPEEVFKYIKRPGIVDHFYEWPGGYKKKKQTYVTDGGAAQYKTVAILTLPEEKKNTMGNREVINNDKEFLNWIYERMICVHGEKDLYDYMINFKSIIDRSGSVAAPKEEETYPQPGKRCVKEGELMIPCHVIEGSDALDYAGKCFGCGSKRAITFDEENQTEADAAREYLIKEGLDPDELVKEGLAVINGIHEKIRLEKELAAAKESIKELLPVAQGMYLVSHRIHRPDIKVVVDRAKALLDKQ